MSNRSELLYSSDVNWGIYGDIKLEDVLLLLQSLEVFIHDVVIKSLVYDCGLKRENVDGDSETPNWLKFPLEMHFKLNRFIEFKLIPENKIDVEKGKILITSLGRLGDRLGVLAQQHERLKRANRDAHYVDEPVLRRRSVNERAISADAACSFKPLPSSSLNNATFWKHSQIVDVYREAMHHSLQELQGELKSLKDLTEDLAASVGDKCDDLSRVDSVLNKLTHDVKITRGVLSKLVWAKRKIISIVGGAGAGALIGMPLGIGGSIIGSALGGAVASRVNETSLLNTLI